MSEFDIDLLREGLANYLETLRQHLSQVQDKSEEAESGFQGLMNIQAGSAAEDYESKWGPASAWLAEYIASATHLAALLEERIQELEQIR